MPNDSASHLSDPLPAPPHLGREDAVDRSSRGSNTSSVPSMVDDHGSDVSVDDDQYYRTSGEQIWDTFWQSGCGEDPEDASSPAAEEPSVSTSYQYPALVTPSPSLSLQPQQFITSRKRPTQTQSLGVIEAPAYAPEHKRLSEQTRIRRRGIHPCRVSYSIFPPPPKTDLSRQRTVRPKRCPPHLTLDTPRERISSEGSPPRQSLRNSASARNLRSGSASSAFSAFSAVSDASVAESDHTAFTTPSASPRESWDTCPRTPKPKHVSQCLDYRKLGTKQSLPNLRSSYRPVVAPRSATAEDFALGQARNSRVVGTVASVEPYPRPLFAPPVVAPLPPARRAPLPPVSERLPPPVSATRAIAPPTFISKRPLPVPTSSSSRRPSHLPPLIISTRPLPPLPLSLSHSHTRPPTPSSAPPRPLRPDNLPSPTTAAFGPPLLPPRPPPAPRTTSAPVPATPHPQANDFTPPVVSVFEWDSDPDSDGEKSPNPANTFAKRIARGFAQMQVGVGGGGANRHSKDNHNNSHNHSSPKDSQRAPSEELTRIRSGETVTKFTPRPANARTRALTVEDIRRVEEEMDKLRLAREQVARERTSVEVVPAAAAAPAIPQRAAGRQKGGGSALFGRMLSWKRND